MTNHRIPQKSNRIWSRIDERECSYMDKYIDIVSESHSNTYMINGFRINL